MIKLQITPENDKCAEILTKKEYVLIGISPFNSHFTVDNIKNTIICGLENFDKVGLFIPDVIIAHTLKGLGYDQITAEKKTLKQIKYLEGKIDKALEMLAKDYDMSKISKAFWSYCQNDPEYKRLYDLTMSKFENDQDFRNNCIDVSKEVMTNNTQNSANKTNKQDPIEATQYLLKKFPFYWDTPAICKVNSAIYIYHMHPEFLKQIYKNRNKYNLLSKNQALGTIG